MAERRTVPSAARAGDERLLQSGDAARVYHGDITRTRVDELRARWIVQAQQSGAPGPAGPTGSPEVRARWAINFACRGLTGLSAAEWRHLLEEVEAFITGYAPEPKCALRVSEDLVREIHEQLGRGLAELVLGNTWWAEIRTVVTLTLGGGNLRDSVLPPAGVTVDAFMMRLFEVLAVEKSRFGICGDCRRPFIAYNRQAFCSRQCSQRVRSRNFREKLLESFATAKPFGPLPRLRGKITPSTRSSAPSSPERGERTGTRKFKSQATRRG